MIKKIAIGIVVLLVLIAGGIYFLYSNLDSIVKAAIEKYGTAATQTDVKVDSVKIALTAGEASLGGVSIANPKGFSSGKAFYLGSIAVKLDTSSVTGSGPIVIREIAIDKPQVTYELANDGGSNLQTIQKNATSYAQSSSGGSTTASAGSGNAGSAPATGPAASGPATTADNKEQRKLIINDLYIRDGQIGISQSLLQGKTFSAALPAIHLSNIGKDTGGATPAQVAQQILVTLSSTAARAASAQLAKEIPSLKGLGGDSGAAVSDQLKGLLGR